MTNSGVEEILDSVRSIVPRLRENGNEAEDRRWVQGLGEFRGRAVGGAVTGWGAWQSRHGLRDHWGVEAQRS